MTASSPSSVSKREAVHDNTLEYIVQLESHLTAAIAESESLNKLTNLVQLARRAPDAHHTLKAIYALYRVTVLLISRGRLNSEGADQREESSTVRAWLWEHVHQYVELLGALLQDEEPVLRISALRIMFSLQKHLSTALTSPAQPQFHINHFRKIVSAVLTCPPSPRSASRNLADSGLLMDDVRAAILNSWLDVFADVRWFFLREAGTMLSAPSSPNIAANLLSLLERLSTDLNELTSWWVEEFGIKPPSLNNSDFEGGDDEDGDENEDDDWRKFFDDRKEPERKKRKSARVHTLTLHQSVHSLASHRAVFTRCWLTLLPRLSSAPASRGYALRVLNVLHRGVLPHLTRPVLVMDWVASCVDYGGTVGLLALNALFTLMTEYNLDYPSFYTRFYTFLDRDVLHVKHRARFFRLAEVFLSSTHLPAALVAAFAKRLARLSLNAPPAAVVMIIPFVYNLLKQHPACMTMIHRPIEHAERSNDPYDERETNPQHTQALASSLWELHSHVRHYHPVVATLASVFEEAFTRPQYAMEDFLDHTYGTMFETEANRRIKTYPVVEDTNLAPKTVIDDLWDFPS